MKCSLEVFFRWDSKLGHVTHNAVDSVTIASDGTASDDKMRTLRDYDNTVLRPKERLPQ